jgi:acyl dehydratase
VTLKAGEVAVGDHHSAVVVEDLPRTQIVQYAGASGDYNPLHSDEPFAREVAGYPGVFAHGMLTMGMTGRMLTDWVGDGRLLEFGVRFTAQVWPGDTLTATATVREIAEQDGVPVARIEVVTVNQDGAPVVTGSAVARLSA